MEAKPLYTVAVIPPGSSPAFDQGYRFVVLGPSDMKLGYYKTEEEARGKADALNRVASAARGKPDG